MTYTKWMHKHFPYSQNWSSADTYKLIEQAKGKTKIIEFILTLIFALSAVYISFSLGGILSIIPYQSVLGWLNIILCLAVAFTLQKSIVRVMIKQHLKRLVLRSNSNN